MAEPRSDDYGAFIERFVLRPSLHSPPSPPPPLHGLTFAVKDIFDIEGYVTGFGNPDWARTHLPAITTAPAVLALLKAGATCVGKTIMDEMAMSVNGENTHYGTPVNPFYPNRVPGGSSSGSAVAVAAGLVDFSLGTDTGGSVRMPAAFCGIFSFRPSHNVISTSNVIPMSQSFDTVGWFARDPITLAHVGRVLLPLSPIEAVGKASHVVVAYDCFKHLGPPCEQLSDILIKSVKTTFGSPIVQYENLDDYISHKVPTSRNFSSTKSENQTSVAPLASAQYVIRVLQRFEFKANHGEWVKTVKPNLGPGISERLSKTMITSFNDLDTCRKFQIEFKEALTDLLGVHGVLAIPTVLMAPPMLKSDIAELEDFRAKAFSLLSIAGLTGFCEISMPLGMCNNVPISISLVASHGADIFLLNFAQALYATLKEQAALAWESGCVC